MKISRQQLELAQAQAGMSATQLSEASGISRPADFHHQDPGHLCAHHGGEIGPGPWRAAGKHFGKGGINHDLLNRPSWPSQQTASVTWWAGPWKRCRKAEESGARPPNSVPLDITPQWPRPCAALFLPHSARRWRLVKSPACKSLSWQEQAFADGIYQETGGANDL